MGCSYTLLPELTNMKLFVLSFCVAASSAGVLISTAPAHHFLAATAPADHFSAATAPADHFRAATAPADFFLQAVAPADHFSAQKRSAAVYTAPNLAPFAAAYTVNGYAPAAAYTAGAPH